jgi:Alginate lyase
MLETKRSLFLCSLLAAGGAVLMTGCAAKMDLASDQPDLGEASSGRKADLGSADFGGSESAGDDLAGTHSGGSDLGGVGGSDLGGHGAGLDPGVPPGGNFDLSGWQLQLPSGMPKLPDIILGPQLAGPTGFTSIYFYTDKTDGAMTLMDPPTGVGTENATHPRTELREVTDGWTTAGTNSETVTVAVPEVPEKVTIGQIFQAAPAPSKPLMELQYLKGGKVQLLLEATNQGGKATPHAVGTVTDGAKFTYELSLTGTTISVTINGKATTFDLPSTFVGESFYFKCGDYDQTAVIADTAGTMPGTVVKIYAISIVHK